MYAFHVLNKRFKSNDYVCLVDASFDRLTKEQLALVFNVVVRVAQSSTSTDTLLTFIAETPYRRVTFVGSECLRKNKQGQIEFVSPSELPRKACNTFDFFNKNVSVLSSAQRVSANRAYQTCRHTYMYLHVGKPESRARELIVKKISTDKFRKAFELNVDNLCAIKRKVCSFDKLEHEPVRDHESISKKLMKKFKLDASLVDTVGEHQPATIGTYGRALSKNRDYSITDKRIADQIKNNEKKKKK